MEELCTACGLCCDGSLFGSTPVKEEEREILLLLKQSSDKLTQPCPALRAGLCTIYQKRPRACQTFRCKLLDSVESRRRETDEALRLVQKVKSLQKKFSKKLISYSLLETGQVPDGSFWRDFFTHRKEFLAMGPEFALLHLEGVRLQRLLDKYFRSKRKRVISAQTRKHS